LNKVKSFKYLGSTVTGNGDLDSEVTHRMKEVWRDWKKVSGVLCDRRTTAKNKGMIYKTVVRPAMMYEAETWPINKAQEKRLYITEMRMLRWMGGITR